MKRLVLLPLLAAVAACGPAKEAPAPPPEATGAGAAPSADLEPVDALVGEYRVAGIDGAPLDAPFGLALSVSAERITFDAPCGGYGWEYRLEGADLRTARTASPDPECLAAARVHHLVFDLAAALDAATSAGRDASNAVVLAGGGHTVTLYSQ